MRAQTARTSAEARDNKLARKYLKQAITIVKNIPADQVQELIMQRGYCEIFTAALTFVDPNLQHGSDMLSYLPPENCSMMLNPPLEPGMRALRTYGEFDYLKSLFLEPKYTRGKVVDFHAFLFMPCPPNENKSRVNKDEEVDIGQGVKRKYNNYTDQYHSIELMKLIYRRSWLEIKLNNAEKFNGLVEQMRADEKILLKRAEKKARKVSDKQPDMQEFYARIVAGSEIKLAILDEIKQQNRDEIKEKLIAIEDDVIKVREAIMRANDEAKAILSRTSSAIMFGTPSPSPVAPRKGLSSPPPLSPQSSTGSGNGNGNGLLSPMPSFRIPKEDSAHVQAAQLIVNTATTTLRKILDALIGTDAASIRPPHSPWQ